MRVLQDGEQPEKPKKSYKSMKEGRGKPGPKAKAATKPAKKALFLKEEEILELERLNNRAKDKQALVAAQESEVRKRLGLSEKDPIPRAWIHGGPKFDKDMMQSFCASYSTHNLVTKAAKDAGVSISTVRTYLKTNPMFLEMVEDAKAIYRDKIVETVYERAVTGIDEAIIGGMGRDQVVAYKRVYSDRLLELEAKRVEHGYRDKGGVEINTGGGVLVVQAGNMDEGDWTKKYGAMEQSPE